MVWSKMTMNHKAVVMVTHLTVFQLDPTPLVPAVMLAVKQVYASRYMNGDLTLNMVFAGAGTPSYLVHINRSHLDGLNGGFSGIKRSALQGPIKAEAAEAIAELRDRLERDAPPARRWRLVRSVRPCPALAGPGKRPKALGLALLHRESEASAFASDGGRAEVFA